MARDRGRRSVPGWPRRADVALRGLTFITLCLAACWTTAGTIVYVGDEQPGQAAVSLALSALAIVLAYLVFPWRREDDGQP